MKKYFIHMVLLMFIATSCNQAVAVQEPAPTFGIGSPVYRWPLVYEMGYSYIETGVVRFLAPERCDSTFMVNLEEKRRLNARIISLSSFLPARFTITGPETRHDDILVWAETAFRRAQMAEIPFIVLGSGGARRVPEGFCHQEAKQQFIQLCKRLAPIAQRYNVTIVIEPLNSGETNFINTLSEGAAIVRAVNHPNIQLLADIFHMKRENEPASNIVTYGAYIRHVHIAEKENRTPPGIAGDDFREFFRALREIGYTGNIAIEARFEDFEAQAPIALQAMKEQFFDN